MKDLMESLFAKNPYRNFDKQGLKMDLQGWHSDREIFKKLIDEVKPGLIIEVGSWKGGSAINMAGILKKSKINAKILCIDTWLGSLEMWKAKGHKEVGFWYDSLMHDNGYPGLYYQFLHNVIAKKMQKIIIPFPNTSVNAARWLAWKNIKAKLIYVDGSHEEDDVYNDVKAYYELLDDKGIMFGDDYSDWPGVKKAVNKFCKRKKIKFKIVDNGIFWVIRKR